MKSKRLIIILSVLVFITVLIVINSTLFTLQNVSINWLTETNILKSVKEYEITDKVTRGQSIFLVKKDDIKSKLEKAYPYLRVVSIETKFPNKIVIHSAERESLYAIKISDNEFALVDDLGKVLQTKITSRYFEGTNADLGAKPIRINFENKPIKSEDFVDGEQVSLSFVVDLITTLSYSLKESSPSYNSANIKGIITTIDVVPNGQGSDVSMKARNGMVLKVLDVEKYTTDKFLLAFGTYNELQQDGVVDCTIEVAYNQAKDRIDARVTD